MGLWVMAGSHCADQLTDGFVPDWWVKTWPNGRKLAHRLVDVGLWTKAERGFRFHQWEDFQPTREQVEAERRSTRDRQQAWRNRRRNGVTNVVTDSMTNAAPTRPDPTIETTSLSASGGAAPADARQLRPVPDDPTTHQLVTGWIRSCSSRPPGRVVGQVATEVTRMLSDGVEPDRISAGLNAWQAKRLHPSTLASVVHETTNSSAEDDRPWYLRGDHWRGPQPPSEPA